MDILSPLNLIIPWKRVLFTLSGSSPFVFRVDAAYPIPSQLVIAGTALKELENEKGIIIRYIIGRRFVSVYLFCDHLIEWRFNVSMYSLFPYSFFPDIVSWNIS